MYGFVSWREVTSSFGIGYSTISDCKILFWVSLCHSDRCAFTVSFLRFLLILIFNSALLLFHSTNHGTVEEGFSVLWSLFVFVCFILIMHVFRVS